MLCVLNFEFKYRISGRQVVLHTELERKLPQVLLEKVDKMELIEYPNDKAKLGFFDLMLRKWLCNPFSDDGECSNLGLLSDLINLDCYIYLFILKKSKCAIKKEKLLWIL